MLAPAALAAGSPRDSGVYDQYTEQIPTAGGSHHSGGPAGGGGSGPTGGGSGPTAPAESIVLPDNLKKDGGADAKTLREIATSPRFGAPVAQGSLPDSASSAPAGLSAAVGAIADGSDGRMVGLFIALLAITAVSLGFAAAARQRA